ncbi:polyamine ABC transporter substrate-binding protein [Aliiroseovarius sp. KMU-50]|uniref:Putrescine-binding periplasmic protein n=1 Tax=Aliiroseovarius salicola TaxID=3009082 RepID=A0ABT4VZR6_9RHOB|nr:polyamine ABC transporter substrate-binding protein [Aliiroseovarius sp. KMU-50]MDA5093664.1 polyamine ABC transporter substrate-binding protein [Aliiroseovarius sp. KMU-50]
MRIVNLGRIIAVIATTLSSQVLVAEEQVLNVSNWDGYFGETTLADFTAETGIAVNYSPFDAAETLETKLLAGGSQYDVVFPSSYMLARLHPIGVFQQLVHSSLSNWENLDDEFLRILRKVDPGNTFAAPYMRGTSGVVYSKGAVAKRIPDAPIDSWDMVFNPDVASKLADCGVFFMDAPGEVVSAALNYIGKDPNSKNEDDLNEAMDMLAAVRPYVRHFNNSHIIDELAKSEICVALTYSGDAATAAWRAEEAGLETDLAYSIPREGAEIWFDVMAIPADAPHPDNAHKFINFLMRPDVIADVTNNVYYANAISASLPFVSDEIKTDPQIYPADATVGKLFTLSPHTSDFLRMRQRAWTEFKYGE